MRSPARKTSPYHDDGKMDRISPEQVRALRARAQHLVSKASRGDLIKVVRSLCGANAQLKPAMLLSLRARIKGLEAADVNDAMQRHLLVRTWAMRGTIHLLHPDDLDLIVPLLGPSLIAKGVRRRLELGLDDKKLAASLSEIPGILSGGEPMTRDELVDRLVRRGIGIDRAGQAPYHLVAYAGLKGLIRIGPDRPDGDRTYVLVDCQRGVRKPLNRVQAIAELAHRYLEAYGPTDLKDLVSWSGLPLADAKKGWELACMKEGLYELKVGDRTLWSIGKPFKPLDVLAPADTVVNLLPAFDTLVLGYADREYIVPEKYRDKVYHGGQTVPVVTVNGLASGTWRYERRGKKLNINIRPFELFDRATAALVKEEAEDVGRFLGRGPVGISGL
jgi:hypothetical protein